MNVLEKRGGYSLIAAVCFRIFAWAFMKSDDKDRFTGITLQLHENYMHLQYKSKYYIYSYVDNR